MDKYHNSKRYGYVYKIVSVLNVAMQFYLFFLLFSLDIPPFLWVLVLGIAYFLTDFINGYVHMYMDNNHNYSSIMGPFIASFHMHHRHPQYRSFPLLKIYFNESGSKFWLVFFLIITICLSFFEVNDYLLAVLIFIGILSSVAEVSHFLCHNGESKTVKFLQKTYFLLSPKHHKNHHLKDNQSYAFLNGMSDFLLDRIAKKVYKGYQNGADIHAMAYEGKDTANR